ncbi:hypothetical protein H257_16411 [Aphanomyces astaci]|uniref:Uncharacterized protein n=1 Tax=Aphanomyces astaci TaxID=112090 RepID=W4FKR9_APHAT|nr:hypothetical protein H257_16411 [Aphanomyces astaci]ETV67323.1 hypothetical protein H257_16411 [Aphanomyces astaci]|eukprot:XP_009843138.1 hypothetical protein H257_16411 [Aphanomyces astaci]
MPEEPPHLPTQIPPRCYFNECIAPAVDGTTKCHFHRHRGSCAVDNCHNQVYARQLCVKHGGKRRCAMPTCTANSRVGNLCSRHTTVELKKTCSEPGCTKQPRALGRCVSHGGGKKCLAPYCTANVRLTSYCSRHAQPVSLPVGARQQLAQPRGSSWQMPQQPQTPPLNAPKMEYSIDPTTWITFDGSKEVMNAVVHWELDCLESLRVFDVIEM